MSIQKDVWVRCDGCAENGFASHTSKQARREARENGWVFRSGKDYCPNCAPKPRVLDGATIEWVCACGLSQSQHVGVACEHRPASDA